MYSTRRINRLIRGWTTVTSHQSRHKTTDAQKRALVSDDAGTSVSSQEEKTAGCKENGSSSSNSSVVGVETQQKTFLQPHLNPYGVWEKWAYKEKQPPPPSNQTEDQGQNSSNSSICKPLDSPWTLAERRALFMYHRALVVAVKQEPDWDFVGSRLDRDPANCKIVSSYITFNWLRHMDQRDDHIYSGHATSRLSILSKMTAGVTFGQLRSLAIIAQQQGIDDGQPPPAAAAVVDGSKVNAETLGWLLKLVAPPCEDILWTAQTVNQGQWTDFEDQQFINECPVLRYPTKDDFPIHTVRWCRSPKSIIKRFRQLVDAELTNTPKRKRSRIKPLTPDEISIIEQAKNTCYPRDLRWADICDKLDENRRSFAQIILLTTSYPLK